MLATLGSGSTECELTLNAVADGKPLAFGTAVKGKGPVQLETHGKPAYLADVNCSVEVTEVG